MRSGPVEYIGFLQESVLISLPNELHYERYHIQDTSLTLLAG